MADTLVHLHATHARPDDTVCRCACGIPCGAREVTAYGGLDPERVTCPVCLTYVGRVSYGDATPAGAR